MPARSNRRTTRTHQWTIRVERAGWRACMTRPCPRSETRDMAELHHRNIRRREWVECRSHHRPRTNPGSRKAQPRGRARGHLLLHPTMIGPYGIVPISPLMDHRPHSDDARPERLYANAWSRSSTMSGSSSRMSSFESTRNSWRIPERYFPATARLHGVGLARISSVPLHPTSVGIWGAFEENMTVASKASSARKGGGMHQARDQVADHRQGRRAARQLPWRRGEPTTLRQ